jgi:GAF domain-containing protein
MGASDAVPTATVVLPVDPPETVPATLRDLIDTLGPHALGVVGGSESELDRPVGDPVVQGVGEPMEDVHGRLVLLTGGRPGRSETVEAVRAAAAGGAHAVVVKAWGEELGGLVRAAQASGVVLLCTPDEMAWRHLDALVTAASTAVARVGVDGAHPHLPGDLFALANAIAGSIGGAVTLEEPSGRVMAYSNLPGHEIDEIRRLAILGRQTPDRPTNAEEYRAVMQAAGPVVFKSSRPDYASRLAVAVRAGHQVLGLIWVLRDRPPLVEDAESVLMDAARAAALHLLRARGDSDPDRVRRGEVLRGLVMGSLDAGTAAPVLGPAAQGGAVLAVVRPGSPLGPREAEAARVTDLVTLHGEYWHTGTVSTVASGQVLLLLPVETADADADPDPARLAVRLRKLGTGIVTAVRRSTSIEVRVGFGPVMHGLSSLPAGLRYAEQVIEVLERREDGPGVATLDDVRTDVVVSALAVGPAVLDEALLLPQVRAVLEHDAAQGTQYAKTLLTYLGTFGDVVMTAQRLSIHDNTARYRVRRLAEMFGIDLAAGDETLVIWSQLRALEALREGG